MAEINVEEIKGYRVEGQIVCTECVKNLEDELAKEDELILADEIEKAEGEKIFFCDRCKSQI